MNDRIDGIGIQTEFVSDELGQHCEFLIKRLNDMGDFHPFMFDQGRTWISAELRNEVERRTPRGLMLARQTSGLAL